MDDGESLRIGVKQMDSVWEFFRSMTFWNWLALIAFIFFPLSALNAFLSLKSRYLDWSAIRSKRKFDKRLQQLKLQLSRVHGYRISPINLLLDTMSHIAFMLGAFFVAFFSLLVALAYANSSAEGQIWVLPFLILSGIATVFAGVIAAYLINLTNWARFPETIAERIIKLVNRGKLRGWLARNDDSMINFLLNHDVFNEFELDSIKEFFEKSKSLKGNKK